MSKKIIKKNPRIGREYATFNPGDKVFVQMRTDTDKDIMKGTIVDKNTKYFPNDYEVTIPDRNTVWIGHVEFLKPVKGWKTSNIIEKAISKEIKNLGLDL